jgi:hypothetical protein
LKDDFGELETQDTGFYERRSMIPGCVRKFNRIFSRWRKPCV